LAALQAWLNRRRSQDGTDHHTFQSDPEGAGLYQGSAAMRSRKGFPDPLEGANPDAEERPLRAEVLLSSVDRRTREVYIALRSGSTYEEIGAEWRISKRAIKKCVARALLAIMENGPE
jgi:DNA-directed RNA polymerase specialized sigma24 family protein